ncbi:PKD domain-containing protein [uncultured Muribaculum sp.]|uniref:PKD domain-containing protein n=1 Tax=uncultured Muribaculum sp. TaxID=1918613 RepID=UPI0025FD2A02|nr:PKD domain-containing protein [uncultured Muribaculum sp.]
MNYRLYIAGIAAMLCLGSCEDDDKTAPLEANMKCDRTEVAAGETVCFMDRSSGNPARWDWTFEGGEPATSQLFSPEVVYTRPGTYSVTLRVGRGDNNSEKVFSSLITVAYPDEVSADFEADKLNAYNTDDVTFTDLSAGFPNTWEWTFTTAEGVSVTSTEQNPVMKFVPGVYTVTLKASSPKSTSTVTKENYLNVIDHDAVAAEFGTSTPLMIIAGETVTFEDRTMGRPEQWSWEFEGADTPTSTERNPTVRYSSPGRFKVKMTANNEINTSTCEKDAYVMVLPSAGLKMWFPFNGNLQDMSPNKDIVMKEHSSDPSKWSIKLDSPSRHDGDCSAQLAGVCKTNTDDYAVLQIANPEQLPGGMQPMTFVMWVKADKSLGTKLGLFQRGRPANSTGSDGMYDANNKDQNQSWARLNSTASSTEGFARWYVNATGQGSACSANTTDKSLLDDEWHCIVFVKEFADGKCVTKIYADGELGAKSTAQTAKDTTKDPFFIGCTTQVTKAKPDVTHPQINVPFIGLIDDVMMYDRSFTADEVKTLYDIMK